MSIHHLKETSLSLKAKGMMSMSSPCGRVELNTTRGLAGHLHKEGVDGIGRWRCGERKRRDYIVAASFAGPRRAHQRPRTYTI